MRRIKSSLVAGAATLLIAGGVVATHPFAGSAQNSATPTAGATQDQENANATPIVGTPLLQPAIDLVAAQQAAIAGQSGAVVTAVELNGDDGTLIYDVTLSNGVDVAVDATTGKVLSTEQADDNGDNEGDNQNGDHNDVNGDQGEDNGTGGGADAEDGSNDNSGQEDTQG